MRSGAPVPVGGVLAGTPVRVGGATVEAPVAYPVLHVDDGTGTQWFNGHGPPPTAGIAGARVGDYYVDDDTGIVYELQEE